ncbi:AraC family transcriptional regulator [Brevibacillus dissolubilis]|uniref:AraC family transcriptional regulator n=1 Tax=Brevibacillus dissolubilis TaxID=1844116 RepID=UPI0021003C70|nr:effector binding domain-containing protein [Brevibacillus dissolubilis]
MDYIRKRRLSQAAQELVESDQKIMEIALTYGFSSHEAFDRAFKKMFGITPRQYRLSQTAPSIKYPKAHLLLHPVKGGFTVEPTIIVKPAFSVIGYELRTTTEDGKNRIEIPAFWQHYLQNDLGQTIPNKTHPAQELGICTDFDPEAGTFSYLICAEAVLSPGESLPEGLVYRTFPEAKYAVFTTPAVPEAEFSHSIHTTWDYVFKHWFPTSGYEHAGAVEIELYDERSASPKSKQMDIYIPIQ